MTPDERRGAVADPSATYLLARLGVVEARVQAAITRRRQMATTDEDDRFRGLYVSDARVDELLTRPPSEPAVDDPRAAAALLDLEADADAAELSGARLRLRRLRHDAGLSATDVELLLIALAPDVDRRFEPLYGYLNDDVSMRRPTVGLALELCGLPSASAPARARFGPDGPLMRAGLIGLSTPDRPALTRELRVPDRVTAHLLGDDALDPVLTPYVVELRELPGPRAQQLARALTAGAPCAYVVDRRGAGAAATAVAAFAAVGRPPLALDLTGAPSDVDAAELALAASREARLRGGGLVVGPVEVMREVGGHLVRALADVEVPVVLHGSCAWDPSWSRQVPVVADAQWLTDEVRAAAWREQRDLELAAGVDAVAATALFRLSPEQTVRAGDAARRQASLDDRPVTAADLQRGARSQNAAGLERLARRVEPVASWDELVLPAGTEAQLRELADRWRHRDLVLDTWGLSFGAVRGRGVSALFAGGSGTGKTLASEVIAGDLGLDLYLIDLSTVVDKYIGETSKNLERIFDEADRVNGVLLFDEADALFGKRSAVSDAKDRHANLEVAFLLQRIESFDGVAILTTNLASNLDEAFMRRLDGIVDFPAPDEAQRRRLWAAKLPGQLPLDDDVDVHLLAERFKLSGSEIRNIVVSAAYRAAGQERAVTMVDLVAATVREHRKVGRHLTRADLQEFGRLLDVED